MKHYFFIIAIAAVALMANSCDNNEIPAPEVLKNTIPEAATVTNTTPCSEIHNASGDLLGYMALSKPASDSIMGYAGETPLMVVFDTDRKIKSVILLENQETPVFVERVTQAGLLDAWNGMTVQEALNTTPDVVTGATFTSNGVIQTMHACLNNMDK